MLGLKVHIAGSAAVACDRDSLKAAHALVAALTDGIISAGGGMVLGVGGEPYGEVGEPCIFDWTCLERIAAQPDPAPNWFSLRPERFVAVSTQSGLDDIPGNRRELWERIQSRSDCEIKIAPPGWRMAGIIRERQVQHGDILVVLGGGAGVEHLAQSYAADGKPVIPIAADIGANRQDGSGGSRFLHGKALSDPDSFFRISSGTGSSAGRLSSLKLDPLSDTSATAADLIRLLGDLQHPKAFYVRLLDDSDSELGDVEDFFRSVVDPVVQGRGFAPDEMGTRTPTTAFMNLDIFKSIHYASVVIVDLTGLRVNCFMELGYALARRRRVIICAKTGSRLPFDSDKLPTHFWNDPSIVDHDRIAKFGKWFDRYIELPPLVD